MTNTTGLTEIFSSLGLLEPKILQRDCLGRVRIGDEQREAWLLEFEQSGMSWLR